MYRLEYAKIREIRNGVLVDIPAVEYEYKLLVETTNLNVAKMMRYELCKQFKDGYVRINKVE